MKNFFEITLDFVTIFQFLETGQKSNFKIQNANDGLMKIRIACTLNEQKKLTLKKKDAMHTSDGEIINIGADFIGQIFAIIIGKLSNRFQTVAADWRDQSESNLQAPVKNILLKAFFNRTLKVVSLSKVVIE